MERKHIYIFLLSLMSVIYAAFIMLLIKYIDFTDLGTFSIVDLLYNPLFAFLLIYLITSTIGFIAFTILEGLGSNPYIAIVAFILGIVLGPAFAIILIIITSNTENEYF